MPKIGECASSLSDVIPQCVEVGNATFRVDHARWNKINIDAFPLHISHQNLDIKIHAFADVVLVQHGDRFATG